MKGFKGLTALMIIVVMMLSMLSFVTTVWAESEISDYVATEEDIELSIKLETLGAITNEFDLSGYVTRGEMAGIVATYGVIPASSGAQVFADVTSEHPYFGAISALYNMGVITGDGSENFNPDEYVTYDEALVYIINVIGHKPFAVREGGYPTGYYRLAVKHGMLKDISMSKGTDKAVVADIYKMLDSCLTAATVVTSYYGDDKITYTLSESESFLTYAYKIKKYKGVVTGTETTGLESAKSNVGYNQIEINGKIYDLKGYSNYNLLGYNVDFYLKSEDIDEIVYLEKTPKMNETIKIDAEDLLKSKTTVTRVYYTDEKDGEHHIDFNWDLYVVYNNQSYDEYGVLRNALPDNGYIEALDNNRDGVYDVLFVYEYRNVIVGTVDSYYEKIISKSGEVIDLSYNNKQVDIYFSSQSNKLEIDSIQTGDLLTITESRKSPKVITVYISRKPISGKIESYDSQLGYLIDGEWYKVASDYTGETITLGVEGTFYLDLNNRIGNYDRAIADDYSVAVMSGLEYESGNLAKKVTVRLFDKNSTFHYLELNEKVKIDGVRYDLNKDMTEVLTELATEISGDDYLVNSAYIVNYTLTENGKIASIDKGGIGGPGKLNVLAKNCTYMIVRTYYMIRYTNAEGTIIRQRYDNTNGLVFGVPSDGNLGDLEEYCVTTLGQDRQYGPTASEYVDNFDVYSYKNTDVAMADVILLRGGAIPEKTVTINSAIDVVTGVSTVENKKGEETCKIYMCNGNYILTPDVTVTIGGETNKVSSSSLVTAQGNAPAVLRPGVAIQYVVNSDGEISALRVAAYYNHDAGTVTPLFADENTYIERDYDSPTNARNFMVGTVVSYDPKSSQMLFTTSTDDTTEYVLYLRSEKIMVYRGEGETAKSGSRTDIAPGDKFVTCVESFYVPSQIILFK